MKFIRSWLGFKFEEQHGKLNMVKPDFYEGIENYGYRKITKKGMKIVIADWLDIRNREIKILPYEIKIIRKIPIKLQKEIFGEIIVNKRYVAKPRMSNNTIN